MTYSLTEQRKKFLTEMVLGECSHTNLIYKSGGCDCKDCGSGNQKRRDFATGQDMLDIRAKLRESGEWDEFYEWVRFTKTYFHSGKGADTMAYLDSDIIRHNVLVCMYFEEKG